MMKKYTLRILYVAILSAIYSNVAAQQDAQYSHYMFNGLNYVPGYAGLEGVTRATLISRKQWLGYQRTSIDKPGTTSPTSILLSVDSRLPFFAKDKSNPNDGRLGAGLLYERDSRGPIITNTLNLSASYHFPIKSGRLGLGARVGAIFQNLINDAYRVVDPSDQIYLDLINNASSQAKFDLAAGAFYQSPKWFAGLGFNHLTKEKFTYGVSRVNSILANHLHITGGYNFKMGQLVITPSTIFQSDLKQLSLVYGPMATYNQKFWLGLNVRQSMGRNLNNDRAYTNDDVILYVGMNLFKDNSMRIGYSIDFTTSGLRAKTATSHEILLSYKTNIIAPPNPQPIRNVRYRMYEED